MEAEEIWKRFQKHMGYTNQEMETFRSDPEKVKMVTQTPEFVKYNVIAEVIESHGCHAGHRGGDRFVMTAGGQLIREKSPKRMCMFALGPVSHTLPAIYESELKRWNIRRRCIPYRIMADDPSDLIDFSKRR